MVGTISIKVNAAKPECPLPPCFSIKGSPTSIRIMDTPRAIGDWNITSVKLVMKYPNNITTAKNATRVGNVWVATVDGCQTVGKVSNGYEILADGMDEQNNAVQGYVLGRGNLIVLDDDTDVARMVGKTTMRYLDDIPAQPAKGDTIVVNGALKIYDGTQWFSFNMDDYYNKEQIDAKVSSINHNIDEVNASVSAMGNSITQIGATVQSVSARTDTLESTMSATQSSVTANTSAINAMSGTVDALTSSVSANASAISAIVSSLSSYATISQLGETNRKVLMISAQTVSNYQDIIRLQSSVSAMASSIANINSNLSSYATISYVDASIHDAIGAMLSSQL